MLGRWLLHQAAIQVRPVQQRPLRQVQRLRQQFGGLGEQSVVDMHDMPTAAPVVSQRPRPQHLTKWCKLVFQPQQQGHVARPKAVDALLGIAHQQHLVAAAHRVLDQRAQVGPLPAAGVLEFVQKEVVKARARLFVQEGRILFGHHTFQCPANVGHQHHPVLIAVLLELGL